MSRESILLSIGFVLAVLLGASPSAWTAQDIVNKSGVLIGKVEKVRELGSGGAATVFEATIELTTGEQAQVVLKEFDPNNFVKLGTDYPFDRSNALVSGIWKSVPAPHLRVEVGGLFLREPGQQPKRVVIAELMGVPLSELTEYTRISDRFFPDGVSNLHSLLVDGSRGLNDLFQQRLAHGDVKPANFLTFRNAQGQLRFVLGDLDQVDEFDVVKKGYTPNFLAPEILRTKELRFTMGRDIYALAAVIHRAGFGFTPFTHFVKENLAHPEVQAMALKLIQSDDMYSIIFKHELARQKSTISALDSLIQRESSLASQLVKQVSDRASHDRALYSDFLSWIDSEYAKAAIKLPPKSVDANQLQAVRRFVKSGLSRDPEVRLDSMIAVVAANASKRDHHLGLAPPCQIQFGHLHVRSVLQKINSLAFQP